MFERSFTLREKCKFRTYYFNVIVDGKFPFDIRRFHPYKQKIIVELYRRVMEMPWITELIVFGSSLYPYITPESDLDLAYRYSKEILDKYQKIAPTHELQDVDPNGVDLLNLDDIKETEPIYHNIKKGVRIK